MRIGILGSACDPPHQGHIAAAKRAQKALRLDRLILIPTKIPPHKDRPSIPERTRLEMARLAVKGLKGWAVSDMEFHRKGKSYTRDTVRELKKKYPRDELFWIVGSDSLVSMPWKWKGGWGILDLCTFVVFPRKGHPLKRAPRRMLKKVIVLPRMRYWDVSSSEIRKKIHAGKNVRRFLDPRVLHFIKSHKLYEQSR